MTSFADINRKRHPCITLGWVDLSVLAIGTKPHHFGVVIVDPHGPLALGGQSTHLGEYGPTFFVGAAAELVGDDNLAKRRFSRLHLDRFKQTRQEQQGYQSQYQA